MHKTIKRDSIIKQPSTDFVQKLYAFGRREQDSNLRFPLEEYTLSRRASSTTRAPLQRLIFQNPVQCYNIFTNQAKKHLKILQIGLNIIFLGIRYILYHAPKNSYTIC